MEYLTFLNTALLFTGIGIFLFGLGQLFKSVDHLINIAGFTKEPSNHNHRKD